MATFLPWLLECWDHKNHKPSRLPEEFLLELDEITLNRDAISPAFLVLSGDRSLVLDLQDCDQESRSQDNQKVSARCSREEDTRLLP